MTVKLYEAPVLIVVASAMEGITGTRSVSGFKGDYCLDSAAPVTYSTSTHEPDNDFAIRTLRSDSL